MKLPIQFDLDLGEVFDKDCMGPYVRGPQHRDAAELEAQLSHQFPDVNFIRDSGHTVSIEGRQQVFPESLEDARMRFIFKVQQLLQRAAAEHMSLIIVTHGDAVGAVISMMRYDWKVQRVNYAGYAIASRRVPMLERRSAAIKLEETVYEDPEQWELVLSGGIEVAEVHACSKKRAFALHKYELKKVVSNTSLSTMDSSYLHRDRADSVCTHSSEEPCSPTYTDHDAM
jgi:hypothetical protein